MMSEQSNHEKLIARDWEDYVLLDSGQGRKLEQFGPHRIIRPEPRAIWKTALPLDAWAEAVAEFVAEPGRKSGWQLKPDMAKRWPMAYKDLKFWVELEESKQVGVFPENAVHWDWIEEKVRDAPRPADGRPLEVLNLFGYTGLASLAAARAGANVTHVDAAKRAIRLGQENQTLSGLEGRSIRWLVDDAIKFLEREARRGRHYDGLIMDPPKYGLGPKKERWEFSKGFRVLCQAARRVLSEQSVFAVVTAYALEEPPEFLIGGLEYLTDGLGGNGELGELIALEKSAGRRISFSIYARWEAEIN